MGTVNQVEMDSSDEEPMETEEQNGTQEDLDSSQGKFLRVEPPPKNFQIFWEPRTHINLEKQVWMKHVQFMMKLNPNWLKQLWDLQMQLWGAQWGVRNPS